MLKIFEYFEFYGKMRAINYLKIMGYHDNADNLK